MPSTKIVSFHQMIEYYRTTEQPEFHFWGKINKTTGDFDISPTVWQHDYNINIVKSDPNADSFGFYFSVDSDSLQLCGRVSTGSYTLSKSDEAIIERFTASYRSHQPLLLQANSQRQEELKIREKTSRYLNILESYLEYLDLPHLVKKDLYDLERIRGIAVVDLYHFLKDTTEKRVRENTNTPGLITLFENYLRTQSLEEQQPTVTFHPPVHAANPYSFQYNPNPVRNNSKPVQTIEVKEEQPPDEYVCSISLELMKDPVIVMGSGQTYDRAGIKQHFSTNSTDPLTGVMLSAQEKILIPNIALKKLIEDWRTAHPKKPENDAQDPKLLIK